MKYLALARGRAGFTPDFTSRALLGRPQREGGFFRLQGYHLLWPDFPERSARSLLCNSPDPPCRIECSSRDTGRCNAQGLVNTPGLGSFHFARRYLGSRNFLLLLEVLRCITSLRCLFTPMYSAQSIPLLREGFPIQRSPDQGLVGGSPGLIAASHVFHRLMAPRHPPCTLSSLTSIVLRSWADRLAPSSLETFTIEDAYTPARRRGLRVWNALVSIPTVSPLFTCQRAKIKSKANGPSCDSLALHFGLCDSNRKSVRARSTTSYSASNRGLRKTVFHTSGVLVYTHSGALSTRIFKFFFSRALLVEMTGVEPATPSLQS